MFNFIICLSIAACFIFGGTGCSTSKILKQCKQVGEEDQWVCKTLKPWE